MACETGQCRCQKNGGFQLFYGMFQQLNENLRSRHQLSDQEAAIKETKK